MITKEKLIHLSFEAGIILKGLNGILETIGGLALFFVTPEKLNRLILFVIQDELLEDPKDFIANHLMQLAHSLSLSTQIFVAAYLFSHGVIKIVLVTWLGEHKLWAYPIAIVIFVLFIAYQLYRYFSTGSVWLIFLSIFDMLLIILTWLEYKLVKQRASAS